MHGYLRHLANFAEVTRAGSITGAAGRLGVSASVVSNSLRILESHYGEPLLERRRDGVRVTTKGSEVAEEAGAILDALHRAMDPTGREELAGDVRLALPRETVTDWFESAFACLPQSHPQIKLTLFPDDELEDHTRFARDLYLRISSSSSYGDLNLLWQEESEAVLVIHPALLGDRDPGDAAALEGLPDLAPKPLFSGETQSLSVTGAAARLSLARAGHGMTICIRKSVEQDLAHGRLVRCLPDRVNRRLFVTLGTPQKRPAARVEVVARALRNSFLGQLPESDATR